MVYSKYYILLVYTSYAITFTYVLFGPGIISVRKWELRDRDLEFRLFDGNGNFKNDKYNRDPSTTKKSSAGWMIPEHQQNGLSSAEQSIGIYV